VILRCRRTEEHITPTPAPGRIGEGVTCGTCAVRVRRPCPR